MTALRVEPPPGPPSSFGLRRACPRIKPEGRLSPFQGEGFSFAYCEEEKLKSRRDGEGPRPVRGVRPETREPARAHGSKRVAAQSGPSPWARLLFRQRQPAERGHCCRRLERCYT